MVSSKKDWFLVVAVLAATLLLVGCTDAEAEGRQGEAAEGSAEQATSTTATSPPSSTSTTTEPASQENDPEEDPAAAVVMAGGLTPEFVSIIEAVADVDQVAVIQTGQLRLKSSEDERGTPVDTPAEGFVIQLDGRAYETLASAAAFAPELVDALKALETDELVLSESSAKLRRLETGSVITFDNDARFRVGAVLPDAVVGSAEVVLIGPDAMTAAGTATPRQVAIVDYRGTGEALEELLLAENDGEGIRVFGGRGSDDSQNRDRAVLAQVRVKEIFGEFAYRPRSNGSVEIDPAWVEANIVTADLPLLGMAKCHRRYAEVLTDVLQSLIDDGMSDVIDTGAFQGCWNPRFIGGSDRLSRHAWGIAADINFFNPLDGGPGSPVNQELLDRMAAAGITSGHNWSTPDPGHFEYLSDEPLLD